MKAYLDPEYETTLLHNVFYGYEKPEILEEWATRMVTVLDMSPFAETTEGQTPFHLACLHLMPTFVETHFDSLPPTTSFSSVYHPDMMKERTFLMAMLRRHRYLKDPARLDDYKTIFGRLMTHPSLDLGVKDGDGHNLADYLETYRWLGVLDLGAFDLPPPTHAPSTSPYGLSSFPHHSNHPLVTWCYDHRDNHVFGDEDRIAIETIIATYGLPDIYSGEMIRSDGTRVEIEPFSSQLHKWEYRWSPLADLLPDH